jgi:hypothetical protein
VSSATYTTPHSPAEALLLPLVPPPPLLLLLVLPLLALPPLLLPALLGGSRGAGSLAAAWAGGSAPRRRGAGHGAPLPAALLLEQAYGRIRPVGAASGPRSAALQLLRPGAASARAPRGAAAAAVRRWAPAAPLRARRMPACGGEASEPGRALCLAGSMPLRLVPGKARCSAAPDSVVRPVSPAGPASSRALPHSPQLRDTLSSAAHLGCRPRASGRHAAGGVEWPHRFVRGSYSTRKHGTRVACICTCDERVTRKWQS